MNGFINIIKPEGMSSCYAVGAVKKKLHLPCGHMGTLDPMASGVLPVGIHHASRLFPYMMDKSKTYVAEFRFGILTDTLDITGTVLQETDVIPNEIEIRDVLSEFEGKISQVPPKYSAKNVNGKRGYELARAGKEFTLEPKVVEILKFELLEKINDTDYKFKIECKGGTYIRSLARDLGARLNSLATMTKLDRTVTGVFDYSNGVTVEEIKNATDLTKYIIPADESVAFPKLCLTEYQAKRIIDGIFEDYGFNDGTYRVYSPNEFLGVGIVENGILRIKSFVR